MKLIFPALLLLTAASCTHTTVVPTPVTETTTMRETRTSVDPLSGSAQSQTTTTIQR